MHEEVVHTAIRFIEGSENWDGTKEDVIDDLYELAEQLENLHSFDSEEEDI